MQLAVSTLLFRKEVYIVQKVLVLSVINLFIYTPTQISLFKMSQTYLSFRFGLLLTFFLLLAAFFIVMSHWQILFISSPPAELEYNHYSLKNFPTISPITFDSAEYTGDELFREEKSFASTG